VFDAGVRNDALWYASVVQHGYTFSTAHTSSIAFYPVYPILVKLVSLVLANVYVAGMVTSTLCLLAAVPLLNAWMAQHGLGHKAPLALTCMLLFPWSVFYAAMYSESLFLLLALGTFLWYERGAWTQSSACAFLLALSRPNGVIVALALLLMFYRCPHRTIGALLPPLSSLAALGAFSIFQFAAFGTPTATLQAAQVPPWSRGLHQAFLDLTLHPRPGFPSWYFASMLVLGLIVLAAVPFVDAVIGRPYAFFVAATLLLTAASGLISLERYAVTSFPVFAALACTRRPRLLVC
jgi:hypothetical protein